MVFKVLAFPLLMAFSAPAAIIYSFTGTTAPLQSAPSTRESFTLTVPDYLVIPNDSSAFLYKSCSDFDRNQNCGLGVYFSEQSILGGYSANLQFDDKNNTGYVYYFVTGAFEHAGVYVSQDLGDGSSNSGVLTVTDTSIRNLIISRAPVPSGEDPRRNGSTPPTVGDQNGGNGQNPGGTGSGNNQSPGGNGQGGGNTQPGGNGQGGSNQNPGGNNQNPGGNNQNPGGSDQNPGGSNQNPGGNNQNPGRSNQNPGGNGSNSPGGNGNNQDPGGNGNTQPGGNGPGGQTDPINGGTPGLPGSGSASGSQTPLTTPEPGSLGVTLLALLVGVGAYKHRRSF